MYAHGFRGRLQPPVVTRTDMPTRVPSSRARTSITGFASPRTRDQPGLRESRDPASHLRAERRVHVPGRPGAHAPGPVTLDFMAVSSYAKGTTTSGEVRLLKDLDTALAGRDVLIVEDIVDTGLTLHLPAGHSAGARPAVAADRLPAEQAVAAQGRRRGRVHRLHHRGPVRRRLRSRLRGAVPQPPVHRVVDEMLTLHRVTARASRTFAAAVRRPRAITAASIHRQHPPFFISILPFTMVVSHIVAARDVDEVRHRRRRAASGAPPSSDDDDQIGALARLERSDLPRPCRARARRRWWPSPVPAAPVPRVGSLRLELVQERRLAHRLEHVEVVVARGAVGAEPDVTPAARYFTTGAVPLASFMLLSGCATRRRRAASGSRCPRR